jgi:hypothetical protein
MWKDTASARDVNLEVPVYFFKTKQGYTFRKVDILAYLLESSGMKVRNKDKFWYGIPAHFEHRIRYKKRKKIRNKKGNGVRYERNHCALNFNGPILPVIIREASTAMHRQRAAFTVR